MKRYRHKEFLEKYEELCKEFGLFLSDNRLTAMSNNSSYFYGTLNISKNNYRPEINFMHRNLAIHLGILEERKMGNTRFWVLTKDSFREYNKLSEIHTQLAHHLGFITIYWGSKITMQGEREYFKVPSTYEHVSLPYYQKYYN